MQLMFPALSSQAGSLGGLGNSAFNAMGANNYGIGNEFSDLFYDPTGGSAGAGVGGLNLATLGGGAPGFGLGGLGGGAGLGLGGLTGAIGGSFGPAGAGIASSFASAGGGLGSLLGGGGNGGSALMMILMMLLSGGLGGNSGQTPPPPPMRYHHGHDYDYDYRRQQWGYPPPPMQGPPPPPPPPPPPAPTNWTGSTAVGGTWGDPHFKDLTNPDANKYAKDYDVKGDVGKTYSILSDKSIQFNATFVKGDPTIGTIMGQMGLKLHEDNGHETQVKFDAITGEASLDGVGMKNGEKKDIMVDGKPASIEMKDGKVLVNTAEYNMELMKSPDGNHGEQTIKINKNGVLQDWTTPHGLLGQSADGDKNIRHSTDQQGTGAIDYKYQDYEVKDLFSDPKSEINRYGVSMHRVLDQAGQVAQLYDQQGRLSATRDQNGSLVSVRRMYDQAGQLKMYLADGKTEIDERGNILGNKK